MATSETAATLPPLIGQSRPFLDLMEAASRLAPLERPVLVVGERGTGKELIVARLHYLSRRWDRPFVGVNCAALAESLLDSELFGHEAGAFTGADRRRRGRFEQADGGTLFLDEIGTASVATQEKILRATEYGTIQRLGAERATTVDVRVVAATNADLPAAAAAGRFRADLLDRLAFDVLTVPPLRARADDIALLATHFARAFAVEIGWADFPGFSAAAMAALVAHDWPGNVRELRACVERSVARAAAAGGPVADVILDPFASPHRPAAPAAASEVTAETLGAQLARIERAAVAAALARSGHNQRRAAADLGLTYAQLRYLVQKHDLRR